MIWNESEFEMVNVDSQTALATPQDRYFDSGGIAAYSCLIPVSHAVAKVVHFVSGADGEEYGQFATKARAKDEASAVVVSRRAQSH